MARYQINHYMNTPLGQLHIYVDPVQNAKAMKLLNSIPKILANAYEDAVQRYGKEIVKAAQRAIITETPPKGATWPPLSQKYVERVGGDDRIYIKTNQYLAAIGIHSEDVFYTNGAFAHKRWYVGVKGNTPKLRPRENKPGRRTLNQVAAILEVGAPSRNIPARPLWRPLFENKGKDSIKRYVVNAIKRQLINYM